MSTQFWQKRNKDAQVARWMGWLSVGTRRMAGPGTALDEKMMGLPPNPDAMSVTEVPLYCTDWHECMAMCYAIERSGLTEAWVRALLSIVDSNASLFDSAIECSDSDGLAGPNLAFALATAEKEQRVNALLVVLEKLGERS